MPYGYGGNSSGGGGSSQRWTRYLVEVTSGILAAKQFSAASTPIGTVWVTVCGVGAQRPGTDYLVSGGTVSWGSIEGGLNDLLVAGDVLIVEHATAA